MFSMMMIQDPAASAAALQAMIPKASTKTPPDAGTKPAIGSAVAYAREDHTHEVRARRSRVTLAAGTGIYVNKFVATWVFDKPFATKPIIVCSPEDDGGQPVIAGAVTASFTKNAEGLWASVIIRGWRAQMVPQNLITLLAGTAFNLFAATPVGVVIGVTAAEETPITV